MKLNKTLFGVSFGPIYELMIHSEKTRELWFSSYLFSCYSRIFIEKLDKDNYHLIKPTKNALNVLSDSGKKSKAGFFPDHLIGYSDKTPEAARDELKQIREETNGEILKIIDSLIDGKEHIYINPKEGKIQVKTIIDSYLEISIIVFEMEIEKSKEYEIIPAVEIHINSLEKNRTFKLRENKNTCQRCLILPITNKTTIMEKGDKERVVKDVCPLCFLKLNAHKSVEIQKYADINSDRPFPPIDEICKSNINGGKTIERYIAMVKGDGDNLGNLFKKMNTTEEYEKFSENISKFALSVDQITKAYKGCPVYIGGDEFLTLVPVAYISKAGFKTVFDYLKGIRKQYRIYLGGETVSFGINIAYYKYPLSYMLQDVEDELEMKAKAAPGKNSVAIQLTQHSYVRTWLHFSFADRSFIYFKNLLERAISNPTEFPKSIHYKIKLYRKVLEELSNKDQFENFWSNIFEERSTKKVFLRDIKKLLLLNLSGSFSHSSELLSAEFKKKGIDKVIAMIKFIRFLTGDKK